MRAVLSGAGLLLAVGLVSGCGGSSEGASEKAFCDAMMFGLEKDPTTEAVDQYVDNLRDTGTPEGIPDGAQEGFEFFVDTAGERDLTLDALAATVEGEDAEKVARFSTYFVETCLDGAVPDEALVTTGKE